MRARFESGVRTLKQNAAGQGEILKRKVPTSSIQRLRRRGLFRGGRMTTLLRDFRRLTLPRRRSSHQSDRSDNDQSSEHEAGCKDLSGDGPAKNQRYKRVNVGMGCN